MFDIGWSELVLIGAVALVVIGPKELPGMLRTVGGAVTKIRRMAAEFQGQISEAMREAEMADVKKTVDGLNDSVSSGTSFNPIQTIRDEIRNAVEGTNPASTTTTAAEPTISDSSAAPGAGPYPRADRRGFRSGRAGRRGDGAGQEKTRAEGAGSACGLGHRRRGRCAIRHDDDRGGGSGRGGGARQAEAQDGEEGDSGRE